MATTLTAPVDAAAAVRDLCAALFSRPDHLRQTLTHQVAHRFVIAPHRHEDLLQFDLILGCGGTASCGGEAAPLHGASLIVAYPGDDHGYTLDPGAPPSRVYHVKIAAEAAPALLESRPLPRLLTGLDRPEDLAAAMQVVCRLNLVRASQHPLMLARLAEAISLWPRRSGGGPGADTTTIAAQAADPAHSDLAAAVELVDRRLADPPSLDEMAAAVHYSTRHFARRFRALFGCTPHAYLTARRLEQARKLLLENRIKIHQIADALGFSSAATFSRWFHQHTAVNPSTYRDDPRVL